MQKAIQNLKADPVTYRTALSDLSADLSLDVLDLMDEIRRQWREA
jgi:hypothetical protein